MSRRFVMAGLLALGASGAVAAPLPKLPTSELLEPHMRMTGGRGAVALTLDCCNGGVDHRVLDVLVGEKIPATLFISGKWLYRNPTAVSMLISMPELFEIGNHGARHLMAVDVVGEDWNVRAAGSRQDVSDEVTNGTKLLQAAGVRWPKWYRGAAALYTQGGLDVALQLGYRIAAFSLNADEGASLGADEVARRTRRAVDGDVIIGHLNQPHRSAGAGLATGILALRDRGMRFVTLSDPVNQIRAVA